MQEKIDLIIAYANKIALSLAIKENFINQTAIYQQDRNVYAMSSPNLTVNFQKYCGPKEPSLCDQALRMTQLGFSISEKWNKWAKLMLQKQVLDVHQTIMADGQENDSSSNSLLNDLLDLNIRLKPSRQKLRRYIIKNYKKSRSLVRKLMETFNIPASEINQKSEKRLQLRKQIMNLGISSKITLEQFKAIALKVYKSRAFQASETWCINFIKKFELEHIVCIPG